MKKKAILFAMAIMLVAQTVFAVDPWNTYNMQFAEKFSANDIKGITTLLKEHSNEMDLQLCLNTVSYSLSRLNGYEFILGTPLNSNRNTIFNSIQLLVGAGVDLNTRVGGLYVKVGNDLAYQRSSAFSNILLSATRGKSPSDVAIVRFLLESGADWYADVYYNNISIFPTSDDGVAIARLLIEYGYNVNKIFSSDDGDSASFLYYAANKGSIAIVRLLVESGAMVNQQYKGKTAAQIAYENKNIDIYNYLKQNGATWSPPTQVATAPPASSRPRQTYDDSYDYSPPPSSSRSSSSSSSGSSSSGSGWADVGKAITESLQSPLESGTYGMAGTNAKVTFTAIGKSGIIMYVTRDNRRGTGSYSINGNTMTVQMEGYTFVYTITSKTSFSGNGESWVKTGY